MRGNSAIPSTLGSWLRREGLPAGLLGAVGAFPKTSCGSSNSSSKARTPRSLPQPCREFDEVSQAFLLCKGNREASDYKVYNGSMFHVRFPPSPVVKWNPEHLDATGALAALFAIRMASSGSTKTSKPSA